MAIIFVIGPCWNNLNTLINTININKNLINNIKHIYIPTNDLSVEKYFKELNNPSITCKYINENQGHQLSCFNSVIAGMNMVLENDLYYNNTDIVIFSHEDCFVNNIKLFNKALDNILINNYDIVCRKYNATKMYSFFEDYYMHDTFYIKRSSINNIFKNTKILKEFNDIVKESDLNVNREKYHTKNRKFSEAHFTNIIENYKIYSIYYNHSTWGDTELGFYHIPSRIHNDIYWDKKNINELY